MLSKRFVLCMYRGIIRNTVSSQLSCHGDRHLCSQSKASDEVLSRSDEREHEKSRKYSQKWNTSNLSDIRDDLHHTDQNNTSKSILQREITTNVYDKSVFSREIISNEPAGIENIENCLGNVISKVNVDPSGKENYNLKSDVTECEGELDLKGQGSLTINVKNNKTQTNDLENSVDHSLLDVSSYLVPPDIIPVKKEVPPLYHVAPYVNESTTLSNLIKLGVSLAEIEKIEGAADVIVKLNFEKEVKPFLLFLKDISVSDENLCRVITKNPFLFKEDLQNLEIRINYLKSKKFSQKSISAIVTRNSRVLSMTVEQIDASLGFFQREFRLTGNEVRSTITKCPRLISLKKGIIKIKINYIKDFLGFTDREIKQMFVTSPKVFVADEERLRENFDYLHNIMELSHEEILKWPQIFDTRIYRIKQRHRYLASIGRAQYNPEKENYVFLRDLVSGSDSEFCENIGKSSVDHFNNFLKML